MASRVAEPPDFELMAKAVLGTPPSTTALYERIAEQLRVVWNARGAADLATIEAALAVQPPSILDQLRALDR